ncbi:MAG: hypothetical protein H0U74_06410 [Bradymonadaceae bacterium]|nr:hypothetical protein [Lujinxingiaceae bacterium]
MTGPEKIVRWPLPLAVIWLLVPLVGIVVRVSLEPILPYDYWWALAMGRIIALSGEIPTTNLFLYTLEADAPFHNQPWLAQWMLYELYAAAGHAGLAVMRNALVAFSWLAVVVLALRRCPDARVVGGLALAVVFVGGGPLFAVRTQLFALVPFVVTLALLVEIADGRMQRKMLWLLVPLTVLWANLHGTFILALVMVGCVGAGLLLEQFLERRTWPVRAGLIWGGALLATALAALINPQGVRLYGYVIGLVRQVEVALKVAEWQPPDPSSDFGILITVTFVASMVVLALRFKAVRLWEVLLFCAMAILAMSAIRSLFWWAAVMLVIVAPHLRALFRISSAGADRVSVGQGVVHLVVASALVVATVLAQPGQALHSFLNVSSSSWARRTGPGQGVLHVKSCVSLVRLLAERGYPGQIFHYQAIGGLLEFELSAAEKPRAVSFVDQRMEIISAKIWDDYFAISSTSPGWQDLVEIYGIETFVLEFEGQWRLIQELEASADWTRVWLDEAQVMFFKAEALETITRWR